MTERLTFTFSPDSWPLPSLTPLPAPEFSSMTSDPNFCQASKAGACGNQLQTSSTHTVVEEFTESVAFLTIPPPLSLLHQRQPPSVWLLPLPASRLQPLHTHQPHLLPLLYSRKTFPKCACRCIIPLLQILRDSSAKPGSLLGAGLEPKPWVACLHPSDPHPPLPASQGGSLDAGPRPAILQCSVLTSLTVQITARTGLRVTSFSAAPHPPQSGLGGLSSVHHTVF